MDSQIHRHNEKVILGIDRFSSWQKRLLTRQVHREISDTEIDRDTFRCLKGRNSLFVLL